MCIFFFFFKQKTAYEIDCDWSSDVCSSDLYGFEVSDAVLGELAKVGFDPVYGARPLKRAIQSEIENPLAKAILEGRFAPKDSIRVDWRGGRMVFEKAPRRAAA